MTERGLYVPTNRWSPDAIGHGLTECAQLREITGQKYLFMLVEHGGAETSAAHRTLLEQGVAEHDVPALHLTDAAWPAVAHVLVAAAGLTGGDAGRAAALLDPRDLAYGAGPNKAFLVAAALDIDVLHRRDSDLVPDVVDGVPRYPGVLEAGAIGRPLRDVAGLLGAEAVPAALRDRRVDFVGSSYLGDAPQDRRDVLAAGLEHAVALQALTRPSGPATPGLADDVRDYFLAEGQRYHPDDHLELDADADRIELGVSCVQGVFRQLPEMPMIRTLGTDYRQRNLLTQLDAPVLFQSRKMRHVYGDERHVGRPVPGAVEYALRDLRLVLLWVASWRQRELIRAAPAAYLNPDGSLDAGRHADALRVALAETLPEIEAMPARFAAVYRNAAASTDGPLAARLGAVAKAASDRATDLVADVVRGVDDYCWLAERWPALVAAAPAAATELYPLILS
ncbi:DUF6271 family protein [Dactylosporangium sp. NPDC051484]|uniref:DUF6271 family protein n=1 Tax=Dactylosporangium sp. NPDC051484 TaxID=3154942 RepID=UPI00344B85D6